MIKSLLVVNLLILVVYSNISAYEIYPITQDSIFNDKEIFMPLEKIWNEAHLNADTTTLSKLWAEDITITGSHMPVFLKILYYQYTK
jgi:hypothetical protein